MSLYRIQNGIYSRGCMGAVASVCLFAGAAIAQTPGLPAAAEPGAPASRIGPPVPAVRLRTTPPQTVPLQGSGLEMGTGMGTQPSMSTDSSGMTVPPLTPASGTRG